MKKLMLTTACGLLMLSTTASAQNQGAIHIDQFTCSMLDGNGDFVTTSSSRAVVTQSANGNVNMACSADVDPSANGGAVHWGPDNTGGSKCGTPGGATSDWRETVSASGQAKLQCHYKTP